MNEKLRAYYGEIDRIQINDGEPIVHRPAEVAAADAIVNPAPPPARTKEQHRLDMLKRGYVECQRCLEFKHSSDFASDTRNPGRLNCQSMCKACVSTYVQTKRQILRNGVRSEGYRYKERSKKRRKRK